ncbi:Zinc metalloprotease (Elastase) [Clostridium bornimense]|uniref:Neutral metalloproteinase n=1 Tax=Clostridium bornimense TaxID=1216932 RepID=W6S1V1_9CLOT|nr:M4 family metallopeptidase [Clostridium bornimense]CDM69874.1 Zinc metalloprotease (Elastase) [Clostridium bornimense]
MGKRTKRLLSLITVCLSIMVTFNGSTAKAMSGGNFLTTNISSIFEKGVKEYSNTRDLGTINNGEAPEVYLDEEDSCKFIDGSYTNIKVENEDDAIESINSIKKLMKINYPEDEFEVSKVNSTGDLVSYKLQQIYNDIPLYGREIVVVTDGEGNTTSVGGNYLEGVSVDTNAEISKENIASYITKIYGSDAKVNNEELVIYSLNDVEPTLCWKVTVEGAKNGELYTVNSFINAKTGELVNEVSLITKGAEQGTGVDLKGETKTFNVNKKDILMSTLYELFDTERNIKIYKANLGYIPGIPITSRNNTWNDPVAVSAIHNFGHVYDYYYNKFNRVSFDNKGASIVASIHYKDIYNWRGLDNAFWSSTNSQFIFGDGYQLCTPLIGALDVVGHEYTHAVVEYTAGLEYQGESGALNESYADILGNIIEGKDDEQWLVGEDIMKNGDIAIRSMANPEELHQPSVIGGEYYVDPNDTTYDNGGVHINSGILNHAAYLMWENGISDKDKLAKLFYNSLFIMNSTANFQDCRIAVTSAANNLGMSSEELDIINNAFDEVGISVKTLE